VAEDQDVQENTRRAIRRATRSIVKLIADKQETFHTIPYKINAKGVHTSAYTLFALANAAAAAQSYPSSSQKATDRTE
jgi:hypothetical protein